MRSLALTALLFAALGAGTRSAPPPSPDPPATIPRSYASRLDDVAQARARLAVRWKEAPPRARAAILDSARALAFHAVTDEILPAWEGTPWAFYGTTETPGEGSIACGYLVTTVLRDAGFHVERARLAQQPSERIVKTFAREKEILRFRHAEAGAVVRDVRREMGDGLYLVGLDYHVGLLVLDGGRADLCHSAVLPPAHVVCEPAVSSGGFVSDYRVVGPVLDDARVTDWLEGRAIPTAR